MFWKESRNIGVEAMVVWTKVRSSGDILGTLRKRTRVC